MGNVNVTARRLNFREAPLLTPHGEREPEYKAAGRRRQVGS